MLSQVRERGARCGANHVVTLDRGGGDLRHVVTWLKRANHPNWLEDGRISMNFLGKVCIFDDARGAKCAVASDAASGHPVGVPGHPRLLVADTYAKEHAAFDLPPGTSALRLLDAERPRDDALLLGTFPSADPGGGKADLWRCDLHPAFDRSGTRIAINVRVGGARAVAVMDFREATVPAVLDDLRARGGGALR